MRGERNDRLVRRADEGRSAKAMIAIALLALLLVTAAPVALLAAVVMMMLGYVAGRLALFGGSVLAAAIAVVLAGYERDAAPSTPKSADLASPLLRVSRAGSSGGFAVNEALAEPDCGRWPTPCTESAALTILVT